MIVSEHTVRSSWSRQRTVVGRQLCGGASRCGRHSRDEIEHVPTEVVPGPAVVGGVAVGVVGERRVGHAAPVVLPSNRRV